MQSEIAERTGVEPSTISRWKSGKEIPTAAVKVAAFCRGHGRNPLEGFVAAGMLKESEAGRGLKASERRFLAELRGNTQEADRTREAARRGASRATRGRGETVTGRPAVIRRKSG